jgi:DsbC/DsbD-like thiol-disulfide interchange protein
MKGHFTNMLEIRTIVLALLGLTATLPAATAASSQWYETDGGRIRLIANEPAPGAGTIKGALEVQLLPGWKTYWRDPGSSGVPPQVDASQTPGVTGVEIGFPPPHRFKDPYGSWVGYKSSTDFAVTYSFDAARTPISLHANVFLGICQEICIPVQADLSVPLEGSVSDPADGSKIDAAFAMVPAKADGNFGVVGATVDNDGKLVVTSKLPDGSAKAELFVENIDGWYFGDPIADIPDDHHIRFTLDIVEAPENSGGLTTMPYTLVMGERAVEGKLTFRPPSR